jgi:hypothetical protein
VRHREIDGARANLVGPGFRLPGELHARLRPAGNLDLAPGEADTAAERLADGLLPREARRVVLGRVAAALAVLALRIGEASRRESGIALQRVRDALDLDQVDADFHGALAR